MKYSFVYDQKYKGFLFTITYNECKGHLMGYQYLIFKNGKTYERQVFKINNVIGFGIWDLYKI